jgi:hypothetical protein
MHCHATNTNTNTNHNDALCTPTNEFPIFLLSATCVPCACFLLYAGANARASHTTCATSAQPIHDRTYEQCVRHVISTSTQHVGANKHHQHIASAQASDQWERRTSLSLLSPRTTPLPHNIPLADAPTEPLATLFPAVTARSTLHKLQSPRALHLPRTSTQVPTRERTPPFLLHSSLYPRRNPLAGSSVGSASERSPRLSRSSLTLLYWRAHCARVIPACSSSCEL